MRVKNLLKEDDAVSPVIGVILMVAITVILAAVIASFVLGLGDTQGDVQPNSSFEFDYENETVGSSSNEDLLTVRLTDGDEIDPANLYIRGSNVPVSNSNSWADYSYAGSTPPSSGGVAGVGGFTSSSDSVSAGQGVVMRDSDMSNYEISLVWETSDDSATLESDSGPDA